MTSDDFSMYDFVDQPIFVLVADANGRPVYHFLNACGRDQLGRGLDQIRGLPAYQIFPGRAAYSVYRQQCAVWSRGEDAEYEIALPVGKGTIWVRTRVIAVRDAAGNVTHMIGASHDITAEHEQAQAHIMATAAAREMEDLVCFAAHDLRSPLGNLKSLAVLMRRNFVDHGDGKAELIDMINDISDKALAVVSSVMGQVMAVGGQDTRQRFDIGRVCDDIMIMLDPMRAHFASYPRREIEADGVVVQIALRNLMDNAIKHAGPSVLQISIDVAEMNAERLLITVVDNGPGFSTDAFKCTRQGRSNALGGFGLRGIERLVRSRGGQLVVVPRTDRAGTEVRIELPGRFVDAAAETPTPLRIARGG